MDTPRFYRLSHQSGNFLWIGSAYRRKYHVILSERQRAKNPCGFEPFGSNPQETLRCTQGDMDPLSSALGTLYGFMSKLIFNLSK